MRISYLCQFFLQLSVVFATRFVVDIEYVCSENEQRFQAKTTLWEDDGLIIFYDLIGYGATYVHGNRPQVRVEGYDPFDLFGFYFEPFLEIEHDCGGSDYEYLSYYYLDPCTNFSEECAYNVKIDLSKLKKRKRLPYLERHKFHK